MKYLPNGECIDDDPPDICENCGQNGEDANVCTSCDGNGWVDDPSDGGTMNCEECNGCGHAQD